MFCHTRSVPRTCAAFFVATVLACSAVALTASDAHAAPNLLSNGDFASCTGHPASSSFSAVSGAWTSTSYQCNGFGGTGAAYNDISTGIGANAHQTFVDTAGVDYTVSALIEASAATPYVTIDGVTIFSANFPATNSGWVEYTGTFLGTGSDTIALVSPSPPGYDAFALVAVSVAADVPEPASMALLGLGTVALGIAKRRRA